MDNRVMISFDGENQFCKVTYNDNDYIITLIDFVKLVAIINAYKSSGQSLADSITIKLKVDEIIENYKS